MSCFITYSTLSVIYIIYIYIKFLNKANGQTCEKKLTVSSIKNRGSIISSSQVGLASHGK